MMNQNSESSPIIEFDSVPEESLDEINQFYENLNKKYAGHRITETLKSEINEEIKLIDNYLKDKYPFNDINVKLTGELAYYMTTWYLQDILKEHKKYCEDKFVEKDDYTRMEVNNMLWDLQLEDRIKAYSAVALPYDIAEYYNNKIFPDDVSVRVLCRY